MFQYLLKKPFVYIKNEKLCRVEEQYDIKRHLNILRYNKSRALVTLSPT